MLISRILLLLLLTFLYACGPVHKEVQMRNNTAETEDKITSLAVVLPHSGNFTVFYDRSKSTATGAALFGLIGAAIEAGIDSSADAKKEKTLASYIGDTNCQTLFEDAVAKTFAEKSNIEVNMIKQSPDKETEYDAILTLDLRYCGFRLIDNELNIIAPFIEMSAKLLLVNDQKVIWDDRESILGKGRFQYHELENNPELTRFQFNNTLTNAGQRMAYKIIFM